MNDRLAELAMQCWRGNCQQTLKLAKARGLNVEVSETKIAFKSTSSEHPPNQAAIPTAIFKGMDPGSILVCLCFAFFGVYWPHIIDTKPLNKLWREEIEREKR